MWVTTPGTKPLRPHLLIYRMWVTTPGTKPLRPHLLIYRMWVTTPGTKPLRPHLLIYRMWVTTPGTKPLRPHLLMARRSSVASYAVSRPHLVSHGWIVPSTKALNWFLGGRWYLLVGYCKYRRRICFAFFWEGARFVYLEIRPSPCH